MALDQLNGLLAFMTVAEQRGFSAAARVLGVSPSALSQAVRALEARIGTPLFVRTTRSVALTDAGERLLRRSEPGLRAVLAAVEEASRRDEEIIGQLRLNVPRIALPFLDTPLLELRRQHPKLGVEVIVDNRFVDVVSEGFDAGIRLIEATEKNMVAVRVAPPFRFVVVGAPSYLNERGRPAHPRDLSRHECVGFRRASGALYVWEFERRGRDLRVVVSGGVVSNDPELMVRAAVLGLGLAYVPDFVCKDALRSGALETVLDEFTPAAPGLFLYFPERARDQPKMQALLSVLRGPRARNKAAPSR